MKEESVFYAPGKIMLTGEYAVLKGAESLAFPVCYGQQMMVTPRADELIVWEAFDKEKNWFWAKYSAPTLHLIDTDDSEKARFLTHALQAASSIAVNRFLDKGWTITTRTNFPVDWGLGTSSTFLVNLAKWVDCDPFTLASMVTKGSGYDIACSLSQGPILFHRKGEKPVYRQVDYQKSFLQNLYLVYSGKKKATAGEVDSFTVEDANNKPIIHRISQITRQLLESDILHDFIHLINEHEQLIGELIHQPPIQKSLFPDFDGAVKSLGAWGGDFLLIATEQPADYVRSYFNQKHLDTILSFTETVL